MIVIPADFISPLKTHLKTYEGLLIFGSVAPGAEVVISKFESDLNIYNTELYSLATGIALDSMGGGRGKFNYLYLFFFLFLIICSSSSLWRYHIVVEDLGCGSTT